MQREVKASDIDDVTDALLTASRVLVGISARSLARVSDEVTLPQYRALVVLASRGPQSLQDLANELDVVPSTATRMCDRLVRKDLIRREDGATDRREVELSITNAGGAIVDTVTRQRRTSLRQIVSDMQPAKRRTLVAALEEFSSAAGEVSGERWFLGWQ